MARPRKPRPAGGKDAPDLGLELGVPNVMPISSWQAWAGNPIPNGLYAVGKDRTAPNYNELDYMLRHEGIIQGLYRLLTLPIRSAFSKGEWISPTEGSAIQETKYANDMWDLPYVGGGMQVGRSMFLSQALLALVFGHSTFEIVKEYRDPVKWPNSPLAGKFVIDKMAYRDPRTVTFLVDDHGNFEGFRQQTNFAGKAINETIDVENAWYWAVNEEQNPLYGRSMFEAAFQHYETKRRMTYITYLAAQFAAIPGRVAELAAGISPKNIAILKRDLAEFGFNTAMTVPQGVKVTAFTGNSAFPFGDHLNYQDKMMTTSILATFLSETDRQVLIDNGKADASADLFVQLLEAFTAELAESWTTKLMPMFIDYNFTSKNYPVYRFAPLTDDTKNAILGVFEALAVLPDYPVTPEFFRTTEMKVAERLGYDLDYKAIQTEDIKHKQLLDDQHKAAQKAQPGGQTQPQGPQSGGFGKPAAPAKVVDTGRLPVALPQLQTSKQIEEYRQALIVLSNLISPEDVPPNFIPEDQNYSPETEER